MPHAFYEKMFTPAVLALQEENGSRRQYARAAQNDAPAVLGAAERDFLAARDSFYLATVNEDGWPYVQHRGGPAGFVQAPDGRTITFADFAGNKQYLSLGNARANGRVALIFVDYPSRTRLKVIGRLEVRERSAHPELAGYGARVERDIVIRVEGFDWNCPQHITPRFTEAEIRRAMAPLEERLRRLEQENRALREQAAAAHRDVTGVG